MTHIARFWHISHTGENVKITIRKGEILSHSHAMETDEGWLSKWVRWSFDGEVLRAEYKTDGTDCDGRLSSWGESECPVSDLESGYVDEEEGIAFPSWRKVGSGQRDYAAEAAGY